MQAPRTYSTCGTINAAYNTILCHVCAVCGMQGKKPNLLRQGFVSGGTRFYLRGFVFYVDCSGERRWRRQAIALWSARFVLLMYDLVSFCSIQIYLYQKTLDSVGGETEFQSTDITFVMKARTVILDVHHFHPNLVQILRNANSGATLKRTIGRRQEHHFCKMLYRTSMGVVEIMKYASIR